MNNIVIADDHKYLDIISSKTNNYIHHNRRIEYDEADKSKQSRNQEENLQQYFLSFSWRKTLKNNFKKVGVNVDPAIWNDGYKIVMKGTTAFPPGIYITNDEKCNLTLVSNASIFSCDSSNKF